MKVVGTDIFHAATALLCVAGASHLVAGNVDLGATAWLLGSIPGVLIGSQVTVKLPERLLRVGLATMHTLLEKALHGPEVSVPA